MNIPVVREDIGKVFRRYYLPRLPARKDARILDFGCGSGRIMEILRAYGYTEVYGYEHTHEAVAEAAPALRARITVAADYGEFLRSAGSWDAVIIKDVIYYFDEHQAEALLAKLREHLMPAAPVLVVIYNGACLSASYVKYKDHGIRQVFTVRSLHKLLSRAGYEVLAIEGLRPGVTGPRSMFHWFAARVWQNVYRIVFWLERGMNAENPTTFETAVLGTARPR